MNATATTPAEHRLQQIELARRAVMAEGAPATDVLVDAWFDRSWIERSWRRCLAAGQRPDERVTFDVVAAQAARRAEDASHPLLAAARPVRRSPCGSGTPAGGAAARSSRCTPAAPAAPSSARCAGSPASPGCRQR